MRKKTSVLNADNCNKWTPTLNILRLVVSRHWSTPARAVKVAVSNCWFYLVSAAQLNA